MTTNTFKKNINLNRIYVILTGFGITTLWVSYLSYKGMSLVEIGLLESVFHLTGFSFEIVTGVLADKYGYKKILILGRIMSIISGVIMIFASSFWTFVIAFIFSALSYNLNSGTNEALLFESLKQLNEEDNYMSYVAKANLGFEISSAVGVFIAGVLAKNFFVYTYHISVVVAIMAIVCILAMTQPIIEVSKKRTVIDYFKEGYKDLVSNPKLLLIMLFFSLLDTILAVFYHYFQDYLSVLGHDSFVMGVLIVIALGFQLVASYKIESVEKKLKRKKTIVLLVFLLCIAIVLAKFEYIVFLAISFTLVMCIITLSFVLNNSYINEMIDSEKRATMLSISSMFYSIFMILLFPIVGLLITSVGYDNVFNILIVIIIVLGVLAYKNID